MIQRALVPLLGALLALQVGMASAESGTADWLERMAKALRTQNYEGVLVYAQGGRMESMRIVHRYLDGREQERLQALSGDAREIHRDDDVITCILPKDRSVKLDRRGFIGLLPDLDESRADSISAHYEIVDRGSTMLAGRVCRAMYVKPLDAYRYGYRMWVDEETAIPLKVELVGGDGSTLEQIMFTQISYPVEIDDAELKSEIDARQYTWIRHRRPLPAAIESDLNWEADSLPPGFQLVSHEQQEMPDMPEPVEHMVFTDGLATVSAFMAPRGVPRKLRGLSQVGPVTVYARMVDDFHVTVVGEVPQATVEQIANQLRYGPPAQPTPTTSDPAPLDE